MNENERTSRDDELVRALLAPLERVQPVAISNVGHRARPARTRRLAYSVVFAAALAIVLAATPLGAVIARGFGDFSDWLNGKPGQPVSSAEQKTIQREERRSTRYSWATFPKGAELRRLITVTRDGIEYKLFGYRAGNLFCLRLSVPGSLLPHTGCAPKSELTRRKKPALVLYADAPVYGRREKTDRITVLRTGQETQPVRESTVTFGIVSDGVTSVRGLSRTNVLDGTVASGSFLVVNTDTKHGVNYNQGYLPGKYRVRSIVANDAAGDEVKVRVAGVDNEYATGALIAPLSGPEFRMAKRQISGVRIGWIERREPRGTPLSRLFWLSGTPVPQCEGEWCGAYLKAREVVYSRQVAPDPGGVVRIGVALRRNGYICSSISFPRSVRWLYPDCRSKHALSTGSWTEGATFHIAMLNMAEGNQYEMEAGLVDDQVRRMTILLSDGKQIPVPIKDNAYVFEVALTDYPIRLVAYNSANRVVGIDSVSGLVWGLAGFPGGCRER